MSNEKFWIVLWSIILISIGCITSMWINSSARYDQRFIDGGFTRKPLCSQWQQMWVKD